ncbi:hypothetical protein BJX61DRAFT_150931 [Aspergillus egyptiacus]|nr:hypothetical protein BJX61DRAFT_150931 [Aspergillus egyptiacus]
MIALFLLGPLLAGQAVATEPSLLLKRHHDNDAFIPDTSPGKCPDDWPICGESGICYNPDEGQTCCPSGTYACPSFSFCLFEPYCCPDHLNAESCATEFGLSLLSEPPYPSQSGSAEPNNESDNGSGSITVEPLYPRPTLPPTSASSITISSTPIPTPPSSIIPPWPSLSIVPSPSGAAYTGVAVRAKGNGAGRVAGLGVVALGLLGGIIL